jgi:predicted dehydrogenase
MPDLRVGVVGVGALGRHHARVLAEVPGARLRGVYDIDSARAAEIARQYDCEAFPDLASFAEAVEAAVVAVPTVSHHSVALTLLAGGRHVLLEKPITTTVDEADELISVAARQGSVLQAGHVERFNPALDVLKQNVQAPRFVEVHRLSPFSPRSLDIDVVLDLMIHDLDIVLALDGSEAVQVDAVGVPVLSGRVDIANARLRFASGLVANLTASRVSAEKVRKFRVFAPRTYVSLDLAARAGQIYRLVDGPEGRPEISVERAAAPEQEPLRRQAEAFVAAALRKQPPAVSGADGRRALALAGRILAEVAKEFGRDSPTRTP